MPRKDRTQARRGRRPAQWPQLPDLSEWAEWEVQLTARRPAVDFLKAAGDPATHPLKWALPDSYESLLTPRPLKRLTRWARRKKLSRVATTQMLREWLADAETREHDAVWALECIAWCHLLSALVSVVPPEWWRALYQELRTTVESAAGINLHDDPLRHQLLAGELPLALAFVLPELQDCRDLIVPACASDLVGDGRAA